MKRVAILGAGFGGLAAAYDLARAGCQVTVYETSERVGGLAAGFKQPHWDWWVEKYYHHWFLSDRHMLGLIAELGWSERVLFPRPYTVVYHRGKFYPFDSILRMALFPGLGWGFDKARFGLVGLYLKLTNNWRALEGTTAESWMRRWVGERVYRQMWEPLMVGKFGERYASQVNMAWLWARMKSRTTRLGTFVGGFQAFAEAFADRLRQMGVTIQLATPVERIDLRPEGGLRLGLPGGEADHDQCLATVSPALLAELAPSLPADYLAGLLNLKSMGAVVMALALKHRLSEQGYYWFNLPKKLGYPFLALVEHTNFVPPERFGGEHIVYCGDYLEPEHEYFHLSQAELERRFIQVLPRFNPRFSPDWVLKTWLFRTRYSQPVPLLDHSRNIPPIQTPIPGLYFASMSQVYPWDRGTNYAVQIGRQAAGLMLAS